MRHSMWLVVVVTLVTTSSRVSTGEPPKSLPETDVRDQSEAVPAGKKYRLWTSADGKRVQEATLLRVDDGTVYVRLRSGALGKLPLSSLSQEDKNYVASLTQEQSNPLFEEIPEVPSRISDATPTISARPNSFNNSVGMKLVYVPPGKFFMGDGENYPETSGVTRIQPGFFIADSEVTQSQWFSVTGTRPWESQPNVKVGDDFPANYVSWSDAVSFCEALAKKDRETHIIGEGIRYSLPSAAQWEYSCRAGSTGLFCFGNKTDDLEKYAWWNCKDSEPFPHAVRKKLPNAFGLYDMHGNVYEWCSDLVRLVGPLDKGVAQFAMRGGAYSAGSELYVRSTHGSWGPADQRLPVVGFRVVCEVRPGDQDTHLEEWREVLQLRHATEDMGDATLKYWYAAYKAFESSAKVWLSDPQNSDKAAGVSRAILDIDSTGVDPDLVAHYQETAGVFQAMSQWLGSQSVTGSIARTVDILAKNNGNTAASFFDVLANAANDAERHRMIKSRLGDLEKRYHQVGTLLYKRYRRTAFDIKKAR